MRWGQSFRSLAVNIEAVYDHATRQVVLLKSFINISGENTDILGPRKMRLLNVHTLELEDFTGREVPNYCILSHRWGNDEVSYKEFRKGAKKDSAGYRKILDFCALVKDREVQRFPQNGNGEERQCPFEAHAFYYKGPIEWVWIDTCRASSHALTLPSIY